MGKVCIVHGCKTRQSAETKKEKIKFYRLPQDEPRRSSWLWTINKRDQQTGKTWVPMDKSARICSKHFVKGIHDMIITIFLRIRHENRCKQIFLILAEDSRSIVVVVFV